jgi:hypothetical protein
MPMHSALSSSLASEMLPRETRKRRDASAPSIIDPVNSFSSDDVSCVQENEESEEELLEWSRGGNNNSSAFAQQRRDAMYGDNAAAR